MTFEDFSYSAFKMPPKPCVVTRPKTCVITRESSTTFTIVIADTTYTLSFKSEEELCSMEIVLRTLESQLAEFFRSERRPPYIRLLLCGTIYVLSADNRPRMQGRSTRSIRFVLDHPSPNCTVTREDDKEYQVVFDRECYSLSLPDPDILLKPERLFTVCGLVESKMGSDPRRYPLRLCVTGLVCVLNFVRLHRPSDVDMVKTIPCFCSVETMPR